MPKLSSLSFALDVGSSEKLKAVLRGLTGDDGEFDAPRTVLMIRCGACGWSRSKPLDGWHESRKLTLFSIRVGKYLRTNGRKGAMDVDIMPRSTSTAVQIQVL